MSRRTWRSLWRTGVLGLVLLLPVVLARPATAQPRSDEALAAALDSVFSAAHASGQFDGVALVARGATPVYQRAFGPADRTWDVPNTTATRFQMASLTKSFTALLVLALVDAGHLDLDAPLTTYLPDYPADPGDRITLHQLLSNTGGVPHYEGLADVGLDVTAFRPLAYTPEAFAALIGQMEPAAEPGTTFHYSSFGFALLGAVVEAVTGQSYGEALRAYVLDPLGLDDTGYAPSGAVVPRLAEGYEPIEDGFAEPPYRHLSNAFAGGGLYTSAPDLHRWALALYDDTLVPAALKRRMRTDHTSALSPNGIRYGYGLSIHTPGTPNPFGALPFDRPYVIHGGSFDGFRSLLVSTEDAEWVVVLLANSGGATDELGLGAAAARLIEARGGQAE